MVEVSTVKPDDGRDERRDRAIARLKKKRDFAGHLLMYVMVNTFLVVIWALTSNGFFWPVFILVGWGIGVVMNAWDVFFSEEFSDERIERELARMDERSVRDKKR